METETKGDWSKTERRPGGQILSREELKGGGEDKVHPKQNKGDGNTGFSKSGVATPTKMGGNWPQDRFRTEKILEGWFSFQAGKTSKDNRGQQGLVGRASTQ